MGAGTIGCWCLLIQLVTTRPARDYSFNKAHIASADHSLDYRLLLLVTVAGYCLLVIGDCDYSSSKAHIASADHPFDSALSTNRSNTYVIK